MPLVRYFFFVGATLLALLFISNAVLPKLPSNDSLVSAVDLPAIRIHSDRKWPEPVVFDTSLPTVVPAPAASTVASEAPTTGVADVSAKVRVREAFAQFVPPDPKKPGPKLLRKPRVAKSRPAPPTMLVAQQPRIGFFGSNFW
jgi:hypothetical protein